MSKIDAGRISNGNDRQERMQRIRVGLTGLAVVLLIVALATALFNRAGTLALSNTTENAAQSKAETDEPLAHLGVAPGAANETAPVQK
jgi:hypothetical protein